MRSSDLFLVKSAEINKKIIPLPWNSDETVGIVRWILDKILARFNNILYCFLVFQWFNMLTTMFRLVFVFVFFFGFSMKLHHHMLTMPR